MKGNYPPEEKNTLKNTDLLGLKPTHALKSQILITKASVFTFSLKQFKFLIINFSKRDKIIMPRKQTLSPLWKFIQNKWPKLCSLFVKTKFYNIFSINKAILN